MNCQAGKTMIGGIGGWANTYADDRGKFIENIYHAFALIHEKSTSVMNISLAHVIIYVITHVIKQDYS